MSKSTRSVIPVWMTKAVRSVMRRVYVSGKVCHQTDLRLGRGTIVSSSHGLEIGRGVAIGPRSVVQVDGKIGDYTLIGMHVQIIGREDHDMTEIGVPMALSTWIGDREPRKRDVIEIGRDVWIGASSVVLGGVVIGEGAVIGAGSVVTRDVPSFSVAVGNPARVVGRRFANDAERSTHSRLLDQAG